MPLHKRMYALFFGGINNYCRMFYYNPIPGEQNPYQKERCSINRQNCFYGHSQNKYSTVERHFLFLQSNQTQWFFKNGNTTIINCQNMNQASLAGTEPVPKAVQQDEEVGYDRGFTNDSSTIADDDPVYQNLLEENDANMRFLPMCPQNGNCPCHPLNQANESFQFAVGEENQTAVLRRYNSPLVEQIRLINNQLNSKEVDLAYFWRLWNSPQRQEFISGLEFVVKPENWPLYRVEFQRPLELFLTIYHEKLAQAPFLAELYPGLPQLVDKITATVEFSPSKGMMRVEEKTSMTLYEHYINEIESRSKQEGAFYIRDESDPKNPLKTPIGDFIASSPLFAGNHAWADIFLRAGIHKRNLIESNPPESQEMEAELRKLKENRRILQQRVQDGEGVLPPEDRPCCAQFLYFNYRVYDRMVSFCPVLTERRTAGLREGGQGAAVELAEVLLDVCALLNSGGGVLLFDTFRSYLQLWPKGDLIDEARFKAIRQLFAEQLRCIHPPVRLDQHVYLSKVPVVRNPISEGLPSTGRNYIEGLFVLRVVVRPREEGAEQVYICAKDDWPRMQVAVVENGMRRVLVGSQTLRFMRRKFAHFYVPEGHYADEEELAMLRRPYSRFIDHPTCLQPEPGPRLTSTPTPGKPGGIKTEESLQTRFKYLTLLVATRTNHGTILQRLRAKGIECEIVVKYLQYHFKAANNSAALFHNIRFDQLLSEVAYKKEFEFNGRFILTILVTPFIRLSDRNKGNLMPEEQFETLKSWLKTEHPTETLTIWRVMVEEPREEWEFYLQTGSKLAMLFMYYVLNHYGEKCSFKNPKNYEKMTLEERDKKLLKFYPRDKM